MDSFRRRASAAVEAEALAATKQPPRAIGAPRMTGSKAEKRATSNSPMTGADAPIAKAQHARRKRDAPE